MKFFASSVVFYLASLATSSPLPQPSGTEVGPVLEDVRAATSEEVLRVFGYPTFEEFLAAQVSERSNIPSSLFKRATQSICQRVPLYWIDANSAINYIRNLPAGTRCGNNQNAPACAIMRVHGTARVGFCGPKATSILCTTTANYLQGIADTCRFGINLSFTGGYQGLNENLQNYVFIDQSFQIPSV